MFDVDDVVVVDVLVDWLFYCGGGMNGEWFVLML